ncbi:hypothetical protein [Photobacterium sanguinicancri]|uniref:Lipoprotein n=1 Tax=Photobacterium sanguinicancri TaxID=875932 RepID=A0ABX4FVT2_9GAMM|nr:hypothetical protein [Photobacterium sanguinicancri]OZS42978.1 hypothetical protein ASV53_15660 [Photobacterium sanguinicancri]
MTQLKKVLLIGSVLAVTAGCSSIAESLVESHTSQNGTEVLIGQAVPKEAMQCKLLLNEVREWKVTDRATPNLGMERLASEVLEPAVELGANYVHLDIPSEVSVMGVPVNILSDAQANYYDCESTQF